MKQFILLLCFILTSAALAQPPYEPVAIWQREGAGDSSLYGSEILALGDQNGDGFNDWAVFGRGWGPPGQINEPQVEFFHGGNPPDTIPYMVRSTETPEEEYLWDARTAGDVNGDGYTDWAIKVELPERNVQIVYLGGPGPHEEPDIVFTAASIRALGDFNGDSFGDLWCYLPWNLPEAVLYGGNPMDTLPDWLPSTSLTSVRAGNLNGDSFTDFVSWADLHSVDVYLGGSVPANTPYYHWPITSDSRFIAQDMNGDGFDELCLTRSGWGEVLWGGIAMDTVEDAHLNFPCSGSGPERIVSAGDFNNDGYNDLVMFHEWCANSYWGVLTLHLGASWINPIPAFIIYGWTAPLDLIHFQSAVSLGDVNNDGVDDLAIGANGGIEQASWRGKAVVLSGDTTLHVAANEPRPPLPYTLDVTAYPNPFNSAATIEIHLPPYSREADLSIFNVLGQEQFATSIAAIGGKVLYHYDASALSTGIYLLHVSSGALQTTTKLMVLK